MLFPNKEKSYNSISFCAYKCCHQVNTCTQNLDKCVTADKQEMAKIWEKEREQETEREERREEERTFHKR